MTTGERLVSISTLTTGTALEHFLNIATGGNVINIINVCDQLIAEVLEPIVIEANVVGQKILKAEVLEPQLLKAKIICQ